jgi:hypothetical protein
MLAATDLVDALSVFAEAGLYALAGGTALWLLIDGISRWRTVTRLESGLEDLATVWAEIDSLMEKDTTAEINVEALVLGRLIAGGTVDWKTARSVAEALGVEDAAGFQRRAHWTAIRIGEYRKKADSEVLDPLDHARRRIGRSPASALPYVLARRPDLAQRVGSATQIAGFLQRCDRVELAVAGLRVVPGSRPADGDTPPRP